MTPTPGRIVRYNDRGAIVPAIVIEVVGSYLTLGVFGLVSYRTVHSVFEGTNENEWHWPEITDRPSYSPSE